MPERKFKPCEGSFERVMTRLPSSVVIASGSYLCKGSERPPKSLTKLFQAHHSRSVVAQ
jgi:hypothetical protein